LPETKVPAFVTLLEGQLPSGRYVASELAAAFNASGSAAA
jgi:hypothetical protein